MARPVARLELAPAQLEELLGLASGNEREATAAKALLRRAEGIRLRDVAEELHVSPSTVTKWAISFMDSGIEGLLRSRLPGRKALAPEKAEAIARTTGSLRQAAKELGVSKTSVERYRKVGQRADPAFRCQETPASASTNVLLRRKLRATWEKLEAIKKDQDDRQPMLMKGRPFFAWVPPEVILGFKPGKPINHALYKQRGFYCPRDVESFMLGLSSPPSKRSQAISSIISGIQESVKFDDPIVVWLDADTEEIVLLDGSLRLAAVAIHRRDFPGSFKLVPVQVFPGRSDAARMESIRRRLGTRSRRSGTSHIASHLLDVVRDGMPVWNIAAAIDPANKHRELLDQLPGLLCEGRRREALHRLSVVLRPPNLAQDDWVPTKAEMSAEPEMPEGYREFLHQLEAEGQDEENS